MTNNEYNSDKYVKYKPDKAFLANGDYFFKISLSVRPAVIVKIIFLIESHMKLLRQKHIFYF